MKIIIRSIIKALPQTICTNANLPKSLETSDEWIVNHTGIKSRYIAAENESCSFLGAEACNKVLEKAEVKPEEVGLLICTTTTPEYKGFPSTACLIQNKSGLVNAACFDLSAACSGFIYALNTAAAMMESNSIKYAIVCSSEILSKICDWSDRSTCVLFGDACGAVLLERNDDSSERGIGTFILGADGSGEKSLFLGNDGYIKMDGHVVYDFAVSKMTKIISELMEKEKLSETDVDYFVCHQANERILKASAKRLGFNFEKFICSIDKYGNTSSASIPITLADMEAEGKIKKGTTIVFAAFGAGLTWAGTVIRF